ncbi:hypothetical protein BH24ACT19_BH24ACT19_14400 [soil metagenome]
MAQGDGGDQKLVKLDDFEGELDEQWQDIKGRKVLDKSGEEVGTVEDLYIYKDASAVHLLKVSGSERGFLIPVDAVTNVTDEGVKVEQAGDVIQTSPEFDSEEVPDTETSRAAYEHYGYPDQLNIG